MSELRLYQWPKNLLVFLPALGANRLGDAHVVGDSLRAFVSFSLIASATYLINDRIDLDFDRRHPMKSARPLASGRFPSLLYLPLLVMTCLGSCVLAFGLPAGFFVVLLLHFSLALLYSFRIRRLAFADLAALMTFYLLRIIGGGVATGIRPSWWLLAFSAFFFLGLAVLKRFVELRTLPEDLPTNGTGRAYSLKHAEILGTAGMVLSGIAVVIFIGYVGVQNLSPSAHARPPYLWLVCPLVAFWTTRIWLLARRGRIHEDPSLFALKDPASWLLATLAVAAVVLAG